MKTLSYDILDENYIAKMALVVLQSDLTIEDEFRHYFNDSAVSLLCNRIAFENVVTPDSLKAMQQHLATTMSLFPIDVGYDAIGYGCTSGALHIGSDVIKDSIICHRPAKDVTNPMRAALTAMQSCHIKNIAYLAPYSEQVSQSMIDFFENHNIAVKIAATFNEPQDKIVGRISPHSIYQGAMDTIKNQRNIDAIFMSCTNMKCAKIIPDIEKETGIFALSSNQCLAWHMAKIAAINPISPEKGRLFSI